MFGAHAMAGDLIPEVLKYKFSKLIISLDSVLKIIGLLPLCPEQPLFIPPTSKDRITRWLLLFGL